VEARDQKGDGFGAGAPPRPSSARIGPRQKYIVTGARACGRPVPLQIGRSAPSGGDRSGLGNMLTMARGFERLRNEE